eukprot:m.886023 g.886023  ORF g.886023 m.886023 type:complete len:553 (+) comp23623_c1_seq8:168-1826(+)
MAPPSALEMSFQVDQLLQLSLSKPASSISQRREEFKRMHGFVQNLIKSQKHLPKKHAVTGTADFTRFIDWLQKEDVDMKNVEIASFGEHGNGLRATKKVNKDGHLLTIPLKLMMSTDTAERSRIADIMKTDKLVSGMQNVALALHLLSELGQGDKSFWAPYISTLPATYSTPLYYSMEELKVLQASAVYDQIAGLYRNVVRQYAYLYKALKDKEMQKALGLASAMEFTFEDYRWAVSAVMTRQNRIPINGAGADGGGPTFALALIPLWDMINHDNGYVTSRHDPAAQQTECSAMADVEAGEQIFMFYGERPNAELLVYSGFVMQDNPHDYMVIKLGIGKNDPLAALKQQLLGALGIPSNGDFSIDVGGVLDAPLNAFLRINAMTEEMLTSFLANPASCASLGDPDVPVSEDNEQKACMFFETRCKLLLRAYGASLEVSSMHVAWCMWRGGLGGPLTWVLPEIPPGAMATRLLPICAGALVKRCATKLRQRKAPCSTRACGRVLHQQRLNLAQLSTADTSYHRKCALLLRRAEMKMLTQAVENVALRALDEEL